MVDPISVQAIVPYLAESSSREDKVSKSSIEWRADGAAREGEQ